MPRQALLADGGCRQIDGHVTSVAYDAGELRPGGPHSTSPIIDRRPCWRGRRFQRKAFALTPVIVEGPERWRSQRAVAQAQAESESDVRVEEAVEDCSFEAPSPYAVDPGQRDGFGK